MGESVDDLVWDCVSGRESGVAEVNRFDAPAEVGHEQETGMCGYIRGWLMGERDGVLGSSPPARSHIRGATIDRWDEWQGPGMVS